MTTSIIKALYAPFSYRTLLVYINYDKTFNIYFKNTVLIKWKYNFYKVFFLYPKTAVYS